MQRWEERAREEVASAYGTTSLVLQDGLKGHLDQLCVALKASDSRSASEIAQATRRAREFGREHGKFRANAAGYSISEVIFEYRILRQVIIQVLEEENSLSDVEKEIITDLIEQAVNDAAAEYSDTQSDLREKFVATLTHDLRQPIAATKMSAQFILKMSDQVDAIQNVASRIIQNMNRADRMIQDLLDVNSIRAGEKLPIKVGECDLVELAKDTLSELTTIHGDRFILDAPTEIKGYWDSSGVRRILENLVNNAVKYGANYQPVNVSLRENSDRATIFVHNVGNPLSPDEVANIFGHYKRTPSAQAGTKKGWGLGLALVRGIAEAHGGSVRVESAPGKGTTFTVEFPRDLRQLR